MRRLFVLPIAFFCFMMVFITPVCNAQKRERSYVIVKKDRIWLEKKNESASSVIYDSQGNIIGYTINSPSMYGFQRIKYQVVEVISGSFPDEFFYAYSQPERRHSNYKYCLMDILHEGDSISDIDIIHCFDVYKNTMGKWYVGFSSYLESSFNMGIESYYPLREEISIPRGSWIRKSKYSKYWIVPDVNEGHYVSHLGGFVPKYVIKVNAVVSDLKEYDKIRDGENIVGSEKSIK